ncbi:MAG: D-2-hydroxyacid dehydrogenase [Spirochaetales bacterium]|nr:D-2-hydroxyacid dehydrogenase [Spirochaetales bacterium]
MKRLQIVVLDGYAANPGDISWEPLNELGEVTLYERTQPDEIIERIKGAEIVLTNKVVITRSIIENSPALRYIGVLATGYNVVDLEAANEKEVVVTNIPAYSTHAVAQLVMALLLEICHNVAHHSRAVFEGRWEKSKDFTFWDTPLIELNGKTMGIIGYGQIGQAVAKIALAMGMRVVVHTRSKVSDSSVVQLPLDQFLKESDIISLHSPLNAETHELIRQETIGKMKDGVIIINTGRGALVNEKDLAEALQSGKVFAAGVDVVSEEPIRGDNPLLKAPNLFITPHIGWATYDSRLRLMEIATANVAGFISGKIQNQVTS